MSRKNTKALDDLLDLGERMRKAQRTAMSGRGASSLRELMQERRRAIEALTKKAMGHLGTSGAAQRDAIAATLEAAIASEDDADEVREGRLVKDLPPPSGFEDIPGLTLVPGTGDDADTGDTAEEDDDSPRARRRAARAAKRGDGRDGAAPDSSAAAAATVTAAAAERDQDDRRRQLEAAVEEKVALLARAVEEAQAAAREATAARAEVSRLQDQLVSANGRAKAATERARVAQWSQSQAQRDLDAEQRKLDAL